MGRRSKKKNGKKITGNESGEWPEGDSQGTETELAKRHKERNSPKEATLWASLKSRGLEWREKRRGDQEKERDQKYGKELGKKERREGQGGGGWERSRQEGRWAKGAGDRKCCL